VITSVIEKPAPATNTAELRRHCSLVARKTALRICGPATITTTSGSTSRRLGAIAVNCT